MTPTCLTSAELSDYVYGKLPESEMDSAAAHVDGCDACQATVISLGERSDTFVNELRRPDHDDPLESEEACRLALGRMLATPQQIPPSDENVGIPDEIGGYQVVGRLGIGGMGTVFKAVHPKLKRTVAIKVLPTSRWASATAVARFTREMEVIGQVDCPQIVRANDAGEENGMHYLVMEHVDGLDLSRVVNRLGPLPVAEACEIARQTATGLQYAHENQLVHRDIKPSNLMLSNTTPRGRVNGRPTTTVKILDLGLALLGEEHADDRDELTTVGQLMGTLDYMSPEQGMDSHDVDIRADIYSLGATLFKLLTGAAPFSGPQYNTLLKRATALANKPTPPIASLRPDLPEELAATIDRMLAKEPAGRFESPEEVALSLAPFAQGADLASLLQQAQQAKEPQPERPPVVLPDMLQGRLQPEAKHAAGGLSNFGRKIAIAVTLVLMAGVAATIIYLTTERGELIVRAADPNVKIRVTRGERTVKQMELVPGDNSITVRSGQYQVELLTHHDRLEVSRDNVTIRRGDRVVVQVHQQRRDAAAGGAMGMPMGGGSSMVGGQMEMMGGGGGMSAMGGSGEMMSPIDGGGAMMGGIGGPMPGSMMGSGTPGSGKSDSGASDSGMSAGVPGSGPANTPHIEHAGPAAGMAVDGGGGGDGAMPMSGPALGPGLASSFAPAEMGMDAVDGMGPPRELKYDGKTYRGWLIELETERKPERLTEAVRAFAALGEGDEALAAESAQAIFQLMRRYGATTPGSSPRGTLVQISQSVLVDTPPQIMLDALARELVAGNTASRRFSLTLCSHIAGFLRNGAVYTHLRQNEQELVRLLVQLPDDEDSRLRSDALEFALHWARLQKHDAREFPALLPALRNALADPEHVVLSVATRGVATHEPDNPQLVPALLRQLSLEKGNARTTSLGTLAMLGPRAAPAIDSLIAVLGELKPVKPQPGMGAGGMGGGGLGGGDMGVGMAGGMGMGMGGMMSGMGGFGGMGGGGLQVDPYLQAIRTLAAIGPAAKRALPVLNKLRTTENIFVGLPYPAEAYFKAIAAAITQIEGRNSTSTTESDGSAKDAEE